MTRTATPTSAKENSPEGTSPGEIAPEEIAPEEIARKKQALMRSRDWGVLLLLSAIWGGSFFLTETGLEGFGPITLAAGRVSLAALALWLFLLVRKQKISVPFRTALAFIIMGLLNNAIPFSLIAWGQIHIESALASILNGATPLFGILFAHLFTNDEKMTPAKAVGVSLGFLGIMTLFAPEITGSGPTERDAATTSGLVLLGQAAIIGATISYALAGVYGRRFKGTPPTVSAASMLTGSSLILIPVAFFVEDPILGSHWTVGAIASVAGIALLCTSFAYLLYFKLLASAGAVNLLLVTLLVPVSATTLGVLFLGESLTWYAGLGLVLIAVGLAFVDGRPLRLFNKHT